VPPRAAPQRPRLRGLGLAEDVFPGQGGYERPRGGFEQRPRPGPEDDPLLMSSASYFRPYLRQNNSAAAQPTAPARVSPLAAVPQQQRSAPREPFPQARGTVLHRKLGEVAQEVASLSGSVAEVLSRPHMHPAELQQILKAAEDVQARTQLSDSDLEQVGWPTKALQQMRGVGSCLERWQWSEEAAKRALAGGFVPIAAVLAALEGLLGAWLQLSALAGGSLRVDLGLGQRAKSAVPMVSALLDQATFLARQQPDVLVLRQLEALLRFGMAQQELRELGVVQLLQQALQELGDSFQGSPQALAAFAERGGSEDGSSRALQVDAGLWRAVVIGDQQAVGQYIHRGLLVSGRLRDDRGHSVLWDAIAFHRVEVALMLLRHFPAHEPHGVDIGELHPRNGNSLLHVASGIHTFTPQAEGLFAVLFERMPEALHLHRNSRDQSFLHVAAGCLNFWVLRFAVARGLAHLFEAKDEAGSTPRSLLAQHLSERRVAEVRVNAGPQAEVAPFPAWFPLGALQPPSVGQRPAFSDVAVEVEDEAHGKVHLHVHRVLLAASSKVWHEALSTAPLATSGGAGGVEEAMTVLHVDPRLCCSADVALVALRFLYTGSVECPFRTNAALLVQLLQLATAYALPALLRSWALGALVHCLEDPASCAVVVPALLGDEAPRRLSAGPLEQRIAARLLFCNEEAWQAAGGGKRPQPVEAALAMLEPLLANRVEGASSSPGAPPAALGTSPLGSGALPMQPMGTATWMR